jgi:hypothetical protein
VHAVDAVRFCLAFGASAGTTRGEAAVLPVPVCACPATRGLQGHGSVSLDGSAMSKPGIASPFAGSARSSWENSRSLSESLVIFWVIYNPFFGNGLSNLFFLKRV